MIRHTLSMYKLYMYLMYLLLNVACPQCVRYYDPVLHQCLGVIIAIEDDRHPVDSCSHGGHRDLDICRPS